MCLGIYAIQVLFGYDKYGLICLAARAVTADLQGVPVQSFQHAKCTVLAASCHQKCNPVCLANTSHHFKHVIRLRHCCWCCSVQAADITFCARRTAACGVQYAGFCANWHLPRKDTRHIGPHSPHQFVNLCGWRCVCQPCYRCLLHTLEVKCKFTRRYACYCGTGPALL